MRTDEEIAAKEVGGKVIAFIAAASWRRITAVPGLPALLLSQAEAGELAAIKAALARYGLATSP
jgi:hypothetical protein